MIKKVIRWLIKEEILKYLLYDYQKEVREELKVISNRCRDAKEYVMQKKLIELGYKVVNVFPEAEIFSSIENLEITQLNKHPTNYFEIHKMD